MSTSFNTLASSLPTTTAPSQEPKKLQEAAKQFEALMITQMMKTARDCSGGSWLSEGDETGEDSSMSMAEEQFAQSMAANGGLGLAKMVVRTMSGHETNASSGPAQSTPLPGQRK
jgi:Rod binding domain-containing protein